MGTYLPSTSSGGVAAAATGGLIPASTITTNPNHCYTLDSFDNFDDCVDKMMPPLQSPPSGVLTDAQGLIVPKKIGNPCLESSDRQSLHRELLFNQKMFVKNYLLFLLIKNLLIIFYVFLVVKTCSIKNPNYKKLYKNKRNVN